MRSGRGWRRVALATLCVLWVASIAAAQSPITYVYDDDGRLVAVIDPNAASPNVAVYNYDAVGNITSIERRSSATVSILGFTPSCAGSGVAVTIWGTAFSSTPAQNTVTFNGTAATVTSATSTQLVVTVPAGATSGPIAVTAPGGSATSSRSFTPGCGAPTITGVSPTVGTAGMGVTITGTNFEPAAIDDRVTFHPDQLAALTAATTTQLNVTVPPNATSGRIRVTTPSGTAVTSGAFEDFFVPPAPYSAGVVDATGRVAFAVGGAAKTVAVGTSAHIGMVTFDANANDRASVVVTSSTFPCLTSEIAIYSPEAAKLKNSLLTCTGGNFIDVTSLPTTGTYTVLVYGNSPGTAVFTLYKVPADVTGTIALGGTPVHVTLATPGQNARLTFIGSAGQRVSAYANSQTFNGSYKIAVLDPAGAELGQITASGNLFLEPVTLSVTGTHTLLVDPFRTATGGADIRVFNVPADLANSIAIGDPAFPLTLSAPGQNATLTFSGGSQDVTVHVTGNTIGNPYGDPTSFCVSVLLKKPAPDNTVLTSNLSCSASFDLTRKTLTTQGLYRVVVDPRIVNTGNISIRVTSP